MGGLPAFPATDESREILAEHGGKSQATDKADVMRQRLVTGAACDALLLIEKGKIGKGRAAKLLGVSIDDILRLAAQFGVTLRPTKAQCEAAGKTAEQISQRIQEAKTAQGT